MDCESLLIELTQKCNLNCLYCFYRDYGRIENEISKNDIINILQKYKHIDNIYLTGGECTLAIDFLDIIKICSEKAPVTIFTNGVSLSETEFLDKVDKYVSNYIITYDEFNDDYPCRKLINKTNTAIKKILLISPEKLIVKVCINKYNYKNLDNIFSYLKEIGVRKVSINFIHNIEKSENQFELDLNELKGVFDILDSYDSIRYINYYDDIKNFYLNKEHNLSNRCKAGKSFFFYDCKGNLHNCPANCNNLKTCLSKECTSLYEMF